MNYTIHITQKDGNYIVSCDEIPGLEFGPGSFRRVMELLTIFLERQQQLWDFHPENYGLDVKITDQDNILTDEEVQAFIRDQHNRPPSQRLG